MSPSLLLRRPLPWAMAYAGVILYGLYALFHLPSGVLPRFEFPQVSVVVHAPGYAAAEMESLVARPLEGQLMGLAGLSTLRTTLGGGTAQLALRFAEGSDPQLALQSVYGAIDRTRASLPPEVNPYAEIMGNAVNEIADYAIRIPPDVAAWRVEDAIRTRVLPALRAIPGIQRVDLFGAGRPTLWIQPDPAALVRHRVGVAALAEAVRQAAALAPVGRLTLGHQDVPVELRSLPRTADELLDIPVQAPGGTVPLAALAQVRRAPPSIHYGVQLDGQPALGLVVFKQPGASTVPVDARLRGALASLQSGLPAGTRVVAVYRQSHLVSLIGHDLSRNLLIGGLLAIAVLAWLLGRRGSVFVLAVSIPASLLAAIGGLYAMGQSLDLLTLGALTVAVGLLADDGIIVVEAIQHRWEAGLAGWEGVAAGLRDIAAADITGTLTTVAAYVPLLAVGGLAGLFTRPFALAMSLALVASLAVSLTLVPLLLARVGGAGDAMPSGRRALAWLARGNERLLALTLRHPRASLAAALAAFALSLLALGVVPVNFLPLPNEGVLLDSFTLAPGSSLDETLAMADRIGAALRRDPAVADVYARIGSAGDTAYTERSYAGEIQIVLRRHANANPLDHLAARLRREAGQPGVQQSFDTPTIERVGESLSGLPQPFEITVYGDRIAALRDLAEAVTSRLRRVPALTDVFDDDAYPISALVVHPRAEAMRQAGLTATDLADQLGLLLRGRVLARIPDGNRRLDLDLRLPDAPYLRPDDLAAQSIRTAAGWIPLGRLATLDLQSQPNQLRHRNGARAMDILATPTTALGSAIAAAKAALADLPRPPGYRIEFGGLYPELVQTAQVLGAAIVGALALTLGILALQFDGLRVPLILLVQAPLAFTGGALALAATGVGLNATGLVGFLTLVGVSLNHGIVLLAYVRAHERQGLAAEDAVRRAVRERFRPIVLTTLTAVLGMLPTAFGFGQGAAPEQGLAIVVVGGVLWSSILSTNLLPALYLRWGRRTAAAPS
ncbi:MAG: efflux RND transporter permease subunit [Candidatus Levyibacteriota bacterium]